MRYITSLIFSLLWVLSSNAQEFGTHWISYPLPDESAEVWFRKSYIMPHRPLQAFANVASTGDYKIYINERNVTGSLKFEGIKNDVLQSRTFDITRYLKAGDNVIAVWYAPQGKPSHGKQLSLEIYGWDQDSVPFHHQTDGSWLCRQPKDCYSGKTERFDARTNIIDWKTEEYQPYGWHRPTGSMDIDRSLPTEEFKVCQSENKLGKVLKPIRTYNDSLGYNIDFGRPFYGTIRITIREAHRGEKLNINGFQYICNGELDEQAFFRFRFQNQRIYTLTWNGRFKKSNIVNIEGLEISE